MLVVMVCTANLCRSPFAEKSLQQWLDASGVDVVVRSTGVDVVEGLTPPAPWIGVSAEFGVDLRDHRSRSPEIWLAGADLVLTMTADHLRAVVVGWPHLIGRATTLGAAASVAGQGGAGPEIGNVVAHLVGPRTASDVLATSRSQDVADPIGRWRRTQRSIASGISEHCERIARCWPVDTGADGGYR